MLIVVRGQDDWGWGVYYKPEISLEESFWLEFNKSIEMGSNGAQRSGVVGGVVEWSERMSLNLSSAP